VTVGDAMRELELVGAAAVDETSDSVMIIAETVSGADDEAIESWD
jgi:hypothetical protein